MEDNNEPSRTELDSHANMPVIGRNAYILPKIGETVDVAPFTPDYKPISVELVDAALNDRIPSTTPGAEPPRDAKDSGSARSHSTHLETSSSNQP